LQAESILRYASFLVSGLLLRHFCLFLSKIHALYLTNSKATGTQAPDGKAPPSAPSTW
jgi:hypothetical protein